MNSGSTGRNKSVEIVNVVATGELYDTVNLEHLFASADKEYVQYDPVHHQGCYIRFKKDGPLITVYNSGKYIIRAGSIDEVHKQNKKLLDYLQEIGVPPRVDDKNFNINNIVGSSDLGQEIDLKPLAKDLSYANPDKDVSVGRLSFSYPETNSTISIFRTGKATIMGAKDPNELDQSWKRFIEDVENLFQKEKVHNNVSPDE